MGWIQRPERSPPLLISRHGNALFMAFCIGGVLWLVFIETLFNGGFDEAVRWLWLPWLAIVTTFVVRYWRWLLSRSQGKAWKAVGTAAVVYPLLLLMSWPYLLAINASLDRGRVVHAGPIEKKWISSGRSRSYLLDLRDAGTGRSITAQVGPEQYEMAKVGQGVRCSYRLGMLGLAYHWRYGSQAPACSLSVREQ